MDGIWLDKKEKLLPFFLPAGDKQKLGGTVKL